MNINMHDDDENETDMIEFNVEEQTRYTNQCKCEGFYSRK